MATLLQTITSQEFLYNAGFIVAVVCLVVTIIELYRAWKAKGLR